MQNLKKKMTRQEIISYLHSFPEEEWRDVWVGIVSAKVNGELEIEEV